MSIVDEFMDLKEETDADLLAMQVGDFYEFFAEDARLASKELGLKMSEKASHGSSYPMAGVPIQDLDDYVETLVDKKEYTVAVADQYEENGNHKRSISRVVTPGTLLEETGESRYLCATVVGSDTSGLAFTDISSGEVVAKEVPLEDTVDEIAVYDPAETLITSSTYEKDKIDDIESQVDSYTNTLIKRDDDIVEVSELENKFRSEFGENSIESLGISESELAVAAVGRILRYLDETQTEVHDSITSIRELNDDEYVSIDARTRHSLEITDTMGYESGNSLFEIMDHTVTTLGRKLLKQYLQRPLVSKDKIVERQKSVSALVEQAYYRKQIRDELEAFPNISRISSKAAYGTATPKEIRQIIDAFEMLESLENTFKKSSTLEETPMYDLLNNLDSKKLKRVKNMIESSISEEVGNSVDIGTIKEGYNEDLDEIIESHEENKEWLESLESKMEEKHNVTHVTVDRNQTDGYYIQVGNSETSKVPDHMTQVKSLKNSVRYKTDELRKRENDIVRLEEKREKIEKEVFDEILKNVSDNSKILQSVGDAIAHIDAIQSLSTHSVQNKWTKPEIKSMGSDIEIKRGRHPVVEKSVEFTPNGVDLSRERQFLIVTGPNMAGKSTYLRQVALISLLGQTGCYVPCDKAKLGIVDAIFARIGSVDEISQGRSTFMVEMSELANILHSSTDNSLAILDEVGRGTATYDGISIARSTIEYLTQYDDNPRPKTLFATHYHELTDMSNTVDTVYNVHLPIESTSDGHSFTHKVVEGPASKSYGIYVADMAGVPDEVVDRSKDILDELKDEEK